MPLENGCASRLKLAMAASMRETMRRAFMGPPD
jgi:hypothetical protein